MKIHFFSIVFLFLVNILLIQVHANEALESNSTPEHNAWLKKQFSEQHQKLIPIVAVADMLFSCNIERKLEPVTYQLNNLILKMDKNRLAEKLVTCLGKDNMQSETALNFGLLGCFHDQLAHFPKEERQQKMALVEKAILLLSRNERKKSLTQCVTEQAIHYLQ